MSTILLAAPSEDTAPLRAMLTEHRADWQVVRASSTEAALQRLADLPIDLAIVDGDLWADEAFHAGIERDFSHLPLIVIVTGNDGADDTVRLMRLGESLFVPRSTIEHNLASTVESVLGSTARDPHGQQISGFLTSTECTLSLDNDVSNTSLIVRHLQDLVEQFGICTPIERARIGSALHEALANAIIHGNLEVESTPFEMDRQRYYALIEQRSKEVRYAARRVIVRARINRSSATFIVRDEGPGFDVKRIPDPTGGANLNRFSGRGILLMRAYMDSVSWNEAGNEVTMMKRVEG